MKLVHYIQSDIIYLSDLTHAHLWLCHRRQFVHCRCCRYFWSWRSVCFMPYNFVWVKVKGKGHILCRYIERVTSCCCRGWYETFRHQIVFAKSVVSRFGDVATTRRAGCSFEPVSNDSSGDFILAWLLFANGTISSVYSKCICIQTLVW